MLHRFILFKIYRTAKTAYYCCPTPYIVHFAKILIRALINGTSLSGADNDYASMNEFMIRPKLSAVFVMKTYVPVKIQFNFGFTIMGKGIYVFTLCT